MEMADLVKNPVSFFGVRRSKFGRKGRSSFGVFRERAIDFFTSSYEFLGITQHPLEILR
ncbi:hypothetical protein [Microcoleus sp. B4-C1]|uniref:hypothetical protein n=1 Tax=Microcoleus sp. B4-C1 TaxID=2818660 RepID=UPI002FD2F243